MMNWELERMYKEALTWVVATKERYDEKVSALNLPRRHYLNLYDMVERAADREVREISLYFESLGLTIFMDWSFAQAEESLEYWANKGIEYEPICPWETEC